MWLVLPQDRNTRAASSYLGFVVEDFSKRMISSSARTWSVGPSEKPRNPLFEARMHIDIITITFLAKYSLSEGNYCSPCAHRLSQEEAIRIQIDNKLSQATPVTKAMMSYSSPRLDRWTGVDHIKSENIDYFLVAKIHLGIPVHGRH
ncbi:hypothetical protein FPQ18DRAFT_382516 [Pyronema domesticum]|nr:hypothetical protein FPQ18DRAFT_382516 [Pyronema domesticum]